jgi:hypothetical protein
MRTTLSSRGAARVLAPLFARASLLTLALIAASAFTQAQESTDEAAFDAAAFDAAAGAQAAAGSVAPVAAGPGQAKTEYLVGGSALVSARAYLPAAMDGYAASASLSGKVFAKVSVPDSGSLYISYGLSQGLFAGRSGSGSPNALGSVDLAKPSYSMNELHYSFDIGKVVFLRIGKQLLAWGPSLVWTPVDFVNASKADAFSSIDLRQGKAGLRLHAPLGKANLFAFADFSGLVDAGGKVGDPAKAVDYAARLDYSAAGFEFGLTGFAGERAQAKGGLDFSGDIMGTAAYGEIAAAPAYSSYEASLTASLGFSRSLGDLKRWTISGEGFYNSQGSDLSGELLAMASSKPLYMGRWYCYAALKGNEFLSPDLATTVSALANLSDLSYTVKLAEDFSFPRSPPFTLTLAYYGGGKDKEFTLLGGDGSCSLSVQTRIDF